MVRRQLSATVPAGVPPFLQPLQRHGMFSTSGGAIAALPEAPARTPWVPPAVWFAMCAVLSNALWVPASCRRTSHTAARAILRRNCLHHGAPADLLIAAIQAGFSHTLINKEIER